MKFFDRINNRLISNATALEGRKIHGRALHTLALSTVFAHHRGFVSPLKHLLRYLALASLSSLVLSCQSSPRTAYDRVELGSQKGPVLAALGNPVRVYRKGGVDRWVYSIPGADGTATEKELWFQDGVVVFKDGGGGKRKQPTDADFEEIK